jgi:sugar phosphate isomerase/epimerase
MKLGFLTALLSGMKLEELAEWAESKGFDCLEIAAWPMGSAKICKYWSTSIDVAKLDKSKVSSIKELLATHKLGISSLAYYANNLAADPEEREAVHKHLKNVIDAASLLNIDLVGTFVGRDHTKSIAQNLKMAGEIFQELVGYAKDRGVRLMIENCPMVGWQIEGLIGNIAYAPFIWEKLFSLVPQENFGLNFDPSHLIWQQIDYCKLLDDFAQKIFHCHAKDTKIVKEKLSRDGIYSEGWWIPKIPGLGHVNWKKFISVLQKIGYSGTLSIELEDSAYEENEDKVKEGLVTAANYLRTIINK